MPKVETLYTQAKADKICELLAEGVPLKHICKLDGMPHYVTALRWQKAHPEFQEMASLAKQDGTHALADECLEIADSDLDPADKRIRIDTRIRLIGKWNSRAYGDKVDVTSDGQKIEGVAVTFRDPRTGDA